MQDDAPRRAWRTPGRIIVTAILVVSVALSVAAFVRADQHLVQVAMVLAGLGLAGLAILRATGRRPDASDSHGSPAPTRAPSHDPRARLTK